MSTFDDPFFNDDGGRAEDAHNEAKKRIETAITIAIVVSSIIGGLMVLCIAYAIISSCLSQQYPVNPDAIQLSPDEMERRVTSAAPGQGVGGTQINGQVSYSNPSFDATTGYTQSSSVPRSPYAAPIALGPFEGLAVSLSAASTEADLDQALQKLDIVLRNHSVQKPGDARNRLLGSKLAGTVQHAGAWTPANEAAFEKVLASLPPDSFRPPDQPDYAAVLSQQAQRQAYSGQGTGVAGSDGGNNEGLWGAPQAGGGAAVSSGFLV